VTERRSRSRRRRSTTATPSRPWTRRDGMYALVGLIALIALLWCYAPTIADLIEEWGENEDYSVGGLVPLAALYLLWQERRSLADCRVRPVWWGVVLILLGQAMRLGGLLFIFESAERYSLVVTVAGVVLLMTGGQVFWRVRWILLFLFLMVPLPGKVHNLVSGPLQDVATAGAVFCLELFGVTVAREGNVILLNDSVPLAVAEACSGLRMLTAFIVVAAVMAYIVGRPRWQKVVLLISSVPVAIACNLARLVVTAELYLVASSETAERFFHDFAGLTMMPLAVLILIGELALMNWLVVPDDTPGQPPKTRASGNA